MVLVVKGGSVPVDVDMEVLDGDLVGNDTGEMEANVLSLDQWVWRVVGGGAIELEDTEVIIALGVGGSRVNGVSSWLGSIFQNL